MIEMRLKWVVVDVDDGWIGGMEMVLEEDGRTWGWGTGC